MGFRVEYWRVEPTELPRVWRHCPYCQVARAFVCSERFRSNAQKKVLDVWLLYRCGTCEAAWKHPVLARRRVNDIDPALRAGFEANDPALVWRHAFDLAALRTHVMRIELSERLCIQRHVEFAAADVAGDEIRVAAAWPCDMRLERLLATQLPISRTELQRRFASGLLYIDPAHPAALRRPLRDGQRICFLGGIGAVHGRQD